MTAEGAEAFGDEDGLGGGVGHGALGEPDGGGGADFFELFRFEVDGGGAVVAFGPREAGGVAVEVSFFDMMELAGAEPVALVVGNVELAIGVETQAIGGAKAGGPRGHLAGFAVDLNNPAAIGNAGIHATGFLLKFSPVTGGRAKLFARESELEPLAADFLRERERHSRPR